MDRHSVCKTWIIPGMFTDQSFITALALKSFVHFDYPACFFASLERRIHSDVNVRGRGCSDSRRHTLNLMNVSCNTSTLHHGVQQNSNRGPGFFSHVTCESAVGLPVLIQWRGPSSHSCLTSQSSHLWFKSLRSCFSPCWTFPIFGPTLLSSPVPAHRFLPFPPPPPFSRLFLLRRPPSATSSLKVCRKRNQIERLQKKKKTLPVMEKETHLHVQAQLTDVCKRSRSGSGAVLKMWEGGQFSVSPKCELAAWKTWEYTVLLWIIKNCLLLHLRLKWFRSPCLQCSCWHTQLYNSYSQLFCSHPAYCCFPKGFKATSTDKAHSHLKWSVR